MPEQEEIMVNNLIEGEWTGAALMALIIKGMLILATCSSKISSWK